MYTCLPVAAQNVLPLSALVHLVWWCAIVLFRLGLCLCAICGAGEVLAASIEREVCTCMLCLSCVCLPWLCLCCAFCLSDSR